MVPEVEKPRVTEIRVRMDCNGCVNKIKKALHAITGIYDLYVDFPQQKITIIGCAEPEKIVKAIKKTRKSALICSHTEQSDEPAQETEPVPESGTTEGGAPPPAEAAPPEAQEEPPLPPDNPPPEEKPVTEPANETSQFSQPSEQNQREEIHVIHHHPPEYGYQYDYGHYHQPGVGVVPPQPVHATHSYNTYKPSAYVTEYAHLHSPPDQYRQVYYSGNNGNGNGNYVTEYAHLQSSRPDQHSPVYYTGNNGNGNGSGNGNITSMFSEENPNACSIV